LVAIPPAVGILGELTLEFRGDAMADFYGTAAQIIATLFVLLAGLFAFLRGGLDPEHPKTAPYVLSLASGVIVSSIFGLAVSLYASASGCSTVFLSFSASATIAVQIVVAGFYSVVAAFPDLLENGSDPQTGNGGHKGPTRTSPAKPASAAGSPDGPDQRQSGAT